ncbi:MAG: 50S ribosomal protein L4 [Candidatus Magasanikbacteria bacterium]|nr:50S ribosomal protein L4 [Candidatus Magasanikbacteria bacterium]
MKTKVYNLSGKETKEMELNDAVFNVAVKPSVVHEVFVAQTNNAREPWADTKNRGEVRGGGKKPWQQKGTGRARHGSIRSPIWKGGGVAFGPLSIRNYHTKINKKTKTVATRMCLTDKAASGALWVLENFSFVEPKTKLFVALLKALPAKQKNFLVVTDGKDPALLKMTNNVQAVKTIRAEDVTVADLLSKQGMLASVDAIEKLATRLAK